MGHFRWNKKVCTAAAGLAPIALSYAICLSVENRPPEATAETIGREPVAKTEGPALLRKLPLSFIENRGQWDEAVQFHARNGGLSAWFERNAITLELRRRQATDARREVPHDRQVTVARLAFEGTSEHVQLEGVSRQSGAYNFFLGNDPSQWRTGIPSYAQVLYRQLYDGVDLQIKEERGQLEYDLRLQPGADLAQVIIRTEGFDTLTVLPDGTLHMQTALGPIDQKPPTTWYEWPSGEREPVRAHFVLLDEHRYGFDVPQRNLQLALVVDPILVFSTYLGGNNWDEAGAIAVDPAGNAYVAGETQSLNFPLLNPYQGYGGGYSDAFVTKFDANGELIYSTYLGGSASEYASPGGIAVDATGNAYVTAQTWSTDFPIQNPYQGNLGGGSDAFVTKLDPTGSALVYSTYLGGSSTDDGHGIAVDPAGNAYVTGNTYSTDFPLQNPYQGNCGWGDAFVTAFDPTGTRLVYSTCLGGSGGDGGYAIAVDAVGNAYAAGSTSSTDFPLQNPYQPTYGGQTDGFVANFDPVGALVYSTYLGGSDLEDPNGIVVDRTGQAHVVGLTKSPNFPTQNPFQPALNGVRDAFVTKLDPTGSALVYSTYLGGSDDEYGFGIKVNAAGNMTVTGDTSSSDFPTQNPYQGTYHGQFDAFVTKFTPSGSALVYSTYLGGTGDSSSQGLAMNAAGNAYIAGWTNSSDFPTRNAYDPTYNGGAYDAFVAQLETLPLGVSRYGASTPSCLGAIAIDVTETPQAGSTTFTVTSTNAPPNSSGILLVGSGQDLEGTEIGGITLYIDRAQPLLTRRRAVSDAVGYSEIPLAIPSGVADTQVFLQVIWKNTESCGGVGTKSASDALDVTIQP